MQIQRAAAVAVAGVLLLGVSGCGGGGDDDDSPAPDPTSESSSPSASEAPSETDSETASEAPTSETPDDGGGAAAGDKTFLLRTADGAIILDGSAPECDNPGESTLVVTFTSADGTAVAVDAKDGKGSVQVSGATEFEGRITAVSVGDTGDVAISGKGSLADDGAEPTSFTITGSCA